MQKLWHGAASLHPKSHPIRVPTSPQARTAIFWAPPSDQTASTNLRSCLRDHQRTFQTAKENGAKSLCSCFQFGRLRAGSPDKTRDRTLLGSETVLG